MRKYNCPYCPERYYRNDLHKHIQRKHEDELPPDYTAYRMAYDIVNNKQGHGNCMICGKPTPWNEKRQKYAKLCGDPKCSEAVKKQYQERMMRVYNKTSLLDDPKQQEKMLAARKISGKYKWSDGTVFVYTGSYEKKFMEFLDKVLEFKSNEIVAPGPVLQYEYKGKLHNWITDFLLIPYNLIIEVKDGGNNPNERKMPIYRAKQIKKEEMITNMGTYSYIRLTDNDFAQFLSILAELKMKVVDHDNSPIFRIHEQEILNKLDQILTEDAKLDDQMINIAVGEFYRAIGGLKDRLIINKHSGELVDSNRDGSQLMLLFDIKPTEDRNYNIDNKEFLAICNNTWMELNHPGCGRYPFKWKSFWEDEEGKDYSQGFNLGIIPRNNLD